MFSSTKRNDEYSSIETSHTANNATVIARGVKVEGEFTSQGDVIIEGEVHGHITTSGMLTVGSEAKLKADVSAQEAVVAGTIEGNITIKGRLELKATAKIFGDLQCETAVVEAGAIMNGKVAIGGSAKPDTHTRNEKATKNPSPTPSES
ncbi:MAG: polymer-forming cytoskeletal protein [Patescibacteria group bacterium]